MKGRDYRSDHWRNATIDIALISFPTITIAYGAVGRFSHTILSYLIYQVYRSIFDQSKRGTRSFPERSSAKLLPYRTMSKYTLVHSPDRKISFHELMTLRKFMNPSWVNDRTTDLLLHSTIWSYASVAAYDVVRKLMSVMGLKVKMWYFNMWNQGKITCQYPKLKKNDTG